MLGKIKHKLRKNIRGDIFESLETIGNIPPVQKDAIYLDWISMSMIPIVERFVGENLLLDSAFIKKLNAAFGTKRFDLLLKRYLLEYFLRLFNILYDISSSKKLPGSAISLEDNPLNRYAIDIYCQKFNISLFVSWQRPQNIFERLLRIFLLNKNMLSMSFKNGIRIFCKRRPYKVMKEATWGLYGLGGRYFHDDFIVDGKIIKKADLLLFSRGVPTEEGRVRGYEESRSAGYSHFDIDRLPTSLRSVITKIIPQYLLSGNLAVISQLNGPMFALFSSLYFNFISYGLAYERVFSNYIVTAELGHDYFRSSHIAEAIVCQNNGTKYYLMHWSDNSLKINYYVNSYLGCDKYLIWGDAHFRGCEGDLSITLATGYYFKHFINNVIKDKSEILSFLGVRAGNKVATFFDESFGDWCKMTEENFVDFWEAAQKLSKAEQNCAIIIKPKDILRHQRLSPKQKERFLRIKADLDNSVNVYIIEDSDKWSFIEAIGVSDIVVTQGMSSSATIALICGIEGLYLDQANYDHPFTKLFKNELVFDNSDELVKMAGKILSGQESPRKKIPAQLLRKYDAYPDDRGLDVLRKVLVGIEANA